MRKITTTRHVTIPDVLRIRRYERAPELGPKVLFFSGGTALNPISKHLKRYTHNSIHLVTPFDSGGSSAILRTAFDMPAVGDLRSRLMALADETISGHPEIVRLFAYRLPKNKPQDRLLCRLRDICEGKDALIADIKNPMRNLIHSHLDTFLTAMPDDFDLRGASIGNLIIAGAYLNNNRKLDQVIFMFSKLINVQGLVNTIVNDNLHLAARLENDQTIVGQHLLTGKEVPAISSAIKELSLVKSLNNAQKTDATLRKKKKRLIQEADLICYPPGSFYSSLCANLMPKGVGSAISQNPCPKIYVPNLGDDPECPGMTRDDSIFKLISQLQEDTGSSCAVSDLLNYVFIDSHCDINLKKTTKSELKRLGIEVVDTRLITADSAPYYDPQLVIAALLSFT